MLDDARRQRLMDLFAEGIDLDPPRRRAFAERCCGDDRELLAELVAMLEVPSESVEGFLVRPVAPPGGPTPVPVIPGYDDFVLIGEGGMGMVYRAQQIRPVRRTVAIKAIRPGMDTRQVLARFDAEREALARMAHPYIAVVHDAGADEHGRPYLAMEYVDGPSITAFCRECDLELAPLLELFVKVCDAVDHAHRRGVLHRDLKPGNVLILQTDQGPIPKVIDFGIAKALEGSLGELTVHTLQGAMLGTPEYMSPEQFEGSGGAVDTRTDVYALGVLLYELLSGVRPFDSVRLCEAGIVGAAKIVRSEVPPRPSTALRTQQVASSGPRPTVHWGRQLHSDLDWVVMKAIEKAPEDRYHTPRDLAEDLRRFLRHEPIEAGPPSGFYRMRKFARRYRAQLAVAGVLIAVLAVGLFGTLWYLFESKANEARAVENAREATGTRLAATAALLATENPNLALLIAIEADARSDDFSVRETILDAVPRQNLVGRFDHADYGTFRAIFVDERRLLTCGIDPVFWLTDIDEERLVHRFVGHADRLTDVALSPDRRHVASASRDGTARIWSLDTAACEQVLEHPGAVSQVLWSPTGDSIDTLGADGRLRRFDVANGSLREVPLEGVLHVAASPDGRRLATVGLDGETAIWARDGRAMRSMSHDGLPPAKSRVRAEMPSRGTVQFSPDGRRIARWERPRGTAGRVVLYDEDGLLLGAVDGAEPVGFVNDRLMCNGEAGVVSVSVADGSVGRVQVEPVAIPELALLMAVDGTGSWAIGFDRREDICIVDLDAARITGRLSGEHDKNRRNRDVAFHPDGERFSITGREVLVGRFEAEFAPFDLPVDGEDSRVVSLSAAGEALALVRHEASTHPRWSLWSIDRRRRLLDLPIADMDELTLRADGGALQGWREVLDEQGLASQAEVATFDLEGRELSRVTLPLSLMVAALRPEGGLFAFSGPDGDGRRVQVFDSLTGAERFAIRCQPGVIYWDRGPRARYLVVQTGSRSGTEVFDLRTGERVASIQGPTGVGHYGVSLDAERDRMFVVLGDLRVRSYDLGNVDRGPLGEYTRIVRSNVYPNGLLPDGSLGWVQCANQVHLFDAVTCAPFAAIDLRNRALLVAARADSSELVTVTLDGRCQRWPLDTSAVARRLAKGTLSMRERDLYRVGAPSERIELEERRLRANPTSRNLALLGESRLGAGDLDGAIDAYRRCCETGPLAPMDLRRYLRLLELLARRHAQGRSSTAQRTSDLTLASAALREAVRCGVTREALDAIPGFEALANDGHLERLPPR